MEKEIILFIILQVVNVILSTVKSIVMIRGNKWASIICNTIYYSFYTLIIKQLTKIDNIWILAGVTAGANFIGTWVGMTVLEKIRKTELWRISTTVKKDILSKYKNALLKAKIKFISYETTWEDYSVVDIFSESKKQTKVIKYILKTYHAHYTVLKAVTKL